MDLIKTGKIISEARKKKNLTQKDLASKLHISDKAISKWERGLSYPDISLLIPLTKELDISLYEILSGEKDEVEETLKNTINYSNKEIQRKKKQIKKKSLIIIFISIIFVFIFGYKIFNLWFYKFNFTDMNEYKEFISGYKVKSVKEITSVSLDDNLYIEYDEIKVKNLFDGYKFTEEQDSIRYLLESENKAISISKTNEYIDYIGLDYYVFGMNDLVFDSINKKDMLKGFETDLELFEYFYETRNESVNIFSSIKDIKKNYYEKSLAFTMLPKIEYITEIKGDLNGYILNINKDVKEISILKNDKRYIIQTIKFTEEEIDDILETLIIE